MNQVTNTTSWLDALRLTDTYANINGGIKQPLKATFGKLNKHRFSRVHPDKEFQAAVLLVEDKEIGETYVAAPNIAGYLGSAATPKILRLAVDNAGVPKIVAQPILEMSGRQNLWALTALQAISMAEREWIRVEADMAAQQYTIIRAANDLGDPQWPSQTMEEIVQEVFKNNVISTSDHPFILQREGRI